MFEVYLEGAAERDLRRLNLVNAMLCIVLPHITAGAFINDDERGLHADYEVYSDRPCAPGFRIALPPSQKNLSRLPYLQVGRLGSPRRGRVRPTSYCRMRAPGSSASNCSEIFWRKRAAGAPSTIL